MPNLVRTPSLLLNCFLLILLSGCATMPEQSRSSRVNNDPFKSSYTLENRLQLANEAYDEGRLVDAEKLFLNIIFEHRNLTDAWFRLGNIYYRSGRYKAAVSAYETVLKQDAEFERAWYNLALSRISQSMEALDMALIKLPQNSPLHARAKGLKVRFAGRMRKANEPEKASYDADQAAGLDSQIGEVSSSEIKIEPTIEAATMPAEESAADGLEQIDAKLNE